METTTAMTIAVVLVIIIVMVYLYYTCKLDKILPAKWDKCKPETSGFVGAMAQAPYLVPCKFRRGVDGRTLNRCTWV